MTVMTFLPATEIDPNSVRPGWVALLIVLALGAATVLLWRSMGKQLKKIDFDGDGADAPAPSDGPASTDSSAAPAGDAEPTGTTGTTPTQSDTKEHTTH
ncbi:hypothetical protein E0H75_27420 [Kribbella capetownensis]|uniref:Uncharacterized protein n=1 Tax=Kribbella capetownensis TaxID=1572659 RepID=A0A4R0JI98_9ACTN|nr:hypothetical protein [Kribbella capetownensis]TCC46773.1 hypothetical protein E0H75_27420 [Kribbella capetownensis]